MTLPTASLYYSDGSSDKVYQVQVIERDDGFVVNFQFGRRGRALQSGTKTARPLPLSEASAVFDKLVLEKTAKGYSPTEGGVTFQDTDKAGRVTGVLPQLLNPVDEDGLADCLCDDTWLAQHKLDGERRLVKHDGQRVLGINRLGLEVPLPQPLEAALRQLAQQAETGGGFVIDGEIIGHRLVAFDLLQWAGDSLAAQPAQQRLSRLKDLLAALAHPHTESLSLVRTALGEAAKRVLLEDLRSHAQEGIVFKRVDAPYTHGRPSRGGDQLKFKFIESATLQVAAVNGAKRSVELQGFGTDGAAVKLGSVTIPANHVIPAAGAIVEVRYLYAYPGGSLFQPVYAGERNDQALEACDTAQLKYKAAHKDDGAA